MANALISSREWEVANLVSTGLSNKQIAHHLSILEGTVRNHLYHIFQKVGVKNRTALTAIILRPHGNLQSATALGRRWQPKD
jgi:DNA-binding NarL/FixJ family response regulator